MGNFCAILFCSIIETLQIFSNVEKKGTKSVIPKKTAENQNCSLCSFIIKYLRCSIPKRMWCTKLNCFVIIILRGGKMKEPTKSLLRHLFCTASTEIESYFQQLLNSKSLDNILKWNLQDHMAWPHLKAWHQDVVRMQQRWAHTSTQMSLCQRHHQAHVL